MSIRELRRGRREAFTLIELLVVMAIIAILISLTLAAVMNILMKKPDVKFRTEASQLDGSIQSAMQKYGVEYLPSQLKVCQNANSYSTTALDQESISFIAKTIGKNSPTFMNTWKTTGINWTGPNTPAAEILEGEQCLVFFLGGIQTFDGTQYTCHGFGPDPAHPDNLAISPADNIGPFFTFEAPRLSPPVTKPGAVYCAYADAYFGYRQNDAPHYYAYFSCYKKENGYNRYRTDGSLVSTSGTAPVMSDCASMGVWPYASTPATPSTPLVYVNSKSWQIICSGLDGNFGPGTDATSPATAYYWNQSTAASIPAPGADDLANFAFGKLKNGK